MLIDIYLHNRKSFYLIHSSLASRIDDRIRQHVISVISADLTRVAMNVSQREARSVDELLGNFVTSTSRSIGVKDMLSMLTGS